MGFDVTAANIIFFIAALTMGSVALGAYWHNAGYVEEARRSDDEHAAELAHTNMTVEDGSYNPGQERFTVEVTNTGTEVLSISALRYLIDGVYVDPALVVSATIDGVASTDLWLPRETLELELDPVTSEPTYFQLVAENGAKGNWRA